MKITPSVCTAALLSAVAGSALADGGHVDAFLIIDPSDKLVTGGFDFDEGEIENTNTRVYEGEFDEFGTIDEPGFNAMSSTNPDLPSGFTALPGNQDVLWTGKAFTHDSQTANLWYWDATGPVNFAPVTGGTTLTIAKAPSDTFNAVFDGSASDVTGFAIETTDANGFLHKHIDFSMNIPTAPDGFYLWALEISVDTYTTDPVYFVHGLGEHDEELHEQAIEYVQSNVVPEPSSLALLGLGGLALMRRRR